MSGWLQTGNIGLGRSSPKVPRRVPNPAARMMALMRARGGSCAFQGDEAPVVDGAGGLGVEGFGADPGDHAALGQVAHVGEGVEEERFAELFSAMGGIGAGGAEPAEALVVAVGSGESDEGAVVDGDVDGAARTGQRAADLERP